MITDKIIKIALDTKNYGLKNTCSHKATLKNNKCGDMIKIEIIVTKNNINNMRYEMEACIFCQATASLLSRKINIFKIKNIKKDVSLLKSKLKGSSAKLPTKLGMFNDIVSKKNIKSYDCIMLPFNALLKALNI